MSTINDKELETISGGSIISYLVKSGDTLGALSKKFNCSIEDICKWNNIIDPNKIEINQKLIFKF